MKEPAVSKRVSKVVCEFTGKDTCPQLLRRNVATEIFSLGIKHLHMTSSLTHFLHTHKMIYECWNDGDTRCANVCLRLCHSVYAHMRWCVYVSAHLFAYKRSVYASARLCVCVYERACMRASMCVCVWGCVYASVRSWAIACLRICMCVCMCVLHVSLSYRCSFLGHCLCLKKVCECVLVSECLCIYVTVCMQVRTCVQVYDCVYVRMCMQACACVRVCVVYMRRSLKASVRLRASVCVCVCV